MNANGLLITPDGEFITVTLSNESEKTQKESLLSALRVGNQKTTHVDIKPLCNWGIKTGLMAYIAFDEEREQNTNLKCNKQFHFLVENAITSNLYGNVLFIIGTSKEENEQFRIYDTKKEDFITSSYAFQL